MNKYVGFVSKDRFGIEIICLARFDNSKLGKAEKWSINHSDEDYKYNTYLDRMVFNYSYCVIQLDIEEPVFIINKPTNLKFPVEAEDVFRTKEEARKAVENKLGGRLEIKLIEAIFQQKLEGMQNIHKAEKS